MKLQHELQLRTANTPLKDIALMMGYRRKYASKASHRIQRVLADPNLGLDSGQYDLKYSDEEFLERLTQVLGIDITWVSKEIERVSDEIFVRKNLYKPWIFIDTCFKRREEPLFVLAFLEQYRRVPIPEIAGLPLYQQVEEVKNWW